MLPTLFTRRTRLEPLTLADASHSQAIFADWDVVKYLNARILWPFPDDGALTYIRDVALPAMESGWEYHWTIRLNDDPRRVIGSVSLLEGAEHNRGFWLGKAWQRRGIMSEATDAITDYWFDVLGRDVLQTHKAIENEGSRRISQRCGMRVIATGERDFVCGRLPAEQYEITAQEWHHYRSTTR